MENLIISSSRAPSPIPIKQDHQFKFSSEKAPNPTISLTKTHHQKLTDAQLNHLCRTGRLREAITALDSISRRGSKVKSKTYINLLQSCIDSDSVQLGRQLHACIGLVRDADSFVETKLVSMYAKCGCLDEARKVFDEMRERNLYTWSAMIGACCRERRWKEVVEFFYLMMEDGVVPDEFLFPKIVQACGNCGDFETGKLIHSLVVRLGMSAYVRVSNSILAIYAKCGKFGFARKFFEVMDERDTVTWNSIITGYCQRGQNEEARKLVDVMCKEGIEPGLVTWNILISSYCQSGNCDVAMELVKKMESNGITPDVFTWTSMISGCAQNYKGNQALDLFEEMVLAGVEPTGVTLASAISACASLKALNNGLVFHSVAVKMGFIDNVLVGNSLIDMYSKCAELDAARWVFDVILEKDIYTWNSMIAGYCQGGYCGKAHELFVSMQESNVSPNVITWNAMISGYMKNRDEDQAVDLFKRMEEDGKVKRNKASWNTVIAGYVQNRQKEKALFIFRQMQSSCVFPNSVTILSVLPACENVITAKKVKEIHACVLRRYLESELSVVNSLIDTYAKSGNIVYSRTIFDRMSSKDIITWNSLIAGYVLHGCSNVVLDLFHRMRKSGLRPNRGTFASIIIAHSLNGLVDEGKRIFFSIAEDYQIIPGLEHYAAVIDLYGRSGQLGEAMQFIEDMPVEPDSSIWSALLTACRIHGNINLAVYAGERLFDLESGNSLIQQIVSQIYALSGKFEDASEARKLDKQCGMRKSFGQSRVEISNVVHTFVPGDRSKPYSDFLYSWICTLEEKAKALDSHAGLCIEEEEKEEIGGIHSEKLALAFALIGSPSIPRSIRISKNLRMCEDCHRLAKYISKTYCCEIYLADSKCFHHFVNGHCSCGDYW